MRHILCVLLTSWPIDRLRRRQAACRHKPLVLVRTVASRQIVVAVSREASDCGIREGLSLAEARALCPQIAFGQWQPQRDRHALVALARWMMRFTPVVDCGVDECGIGDCGTGVPPVKPSHGQVATIYLDVSGCERLYGGLDKLMNQVAETVAKLQIHARLAIAPTPGAAWAVAFGSRENGRIVSMEELAAALAPLPPAALRIGRELAATLYHLGIETIGQVMQLPRNLLPARFGDILLERLDQAMGRLAEPLTPLEPQTPIREGMDFDGVVDSLEAVWIVFKELIGRLVAELTRRGRGVRQLRATFLRADAPPVEKMILLSQPSRDAVNLFNLLRCSLETVQTEEGFAGIHLEAIVTERLTGEQILLLEQEEHDARVELDRLIERLRVKLGQRSVLRPKLIESHIPERAYGMVEMEEQVKTYCPQVGTSCLTGLRRRPLHLLDRPVEVRVMVSPSHDRDGRPISFAHSGDVHAVVHAIGPERLAGQWWDGHDKTRDYFEVEDPAGRRFWIFRVMETGKWYWQGIFE